jgi:acyl-CoA thioesterase-1
MRGLGNASRKFLSICAILAVFLAGINGIGAAEAKTLKLLALGTSLTQGYNLPPGTDYCAVLQARLRAKGYDVSVINAGVSGDTSDGGLARLDWLLEDPVDGVLVELGSNDALRAFDPAIPEKNIDAILGKLAARHIPVLLAGMKAPPNMGSSYVAKFDAIYPALAKKHGVLFYPFFLEGVAAQPKLNQADGMHPNEKGSQVIVTNILPSVEKLIEQIKAQAPVK